jgi:hypothetical protein
MGIFAVLRTGGLLAAIVLSVQGQTPQGPPAQTAPTPGKEAPVDYKGMPPRAAPADYQAQARMGAVTLAADFQEHAVPTAPGPLTSEDYVSVELAFFGPSDTRIKMSAGDFSLRINGKKTPLQSQPYGMVLENVKDPEWVPPELPSAKPKAGGISTGGQSSQADSGPPPPVKIPLEVQRAMALRIQKAVLPEGDRSLPVAGVVFFQYRGQAKGIHSVELIYAGPAGRATLTLTP